MKKIILNASLAVIISAGAISVAHAEPFKGLYTGADLGIQNNKFKSKTAGVNVRARNKQTVPVSGNVGFSTVAANGIFTALEGGLAATFRKDGTAFSPNVTAKVGYRLHERFILAATTSLIYNKFGFTNTQNRTSTKSKFGYAPGVEGLLAVNDKMIIGLGYQFMNSNNVTYTDPTLGKVKVKPSGHKLALKFAYKL